METIEIQDEGIVQIMIKESDIAGYIRELFKKVVWSFGLSINYSLHQCRNGTGPLYDCVSACCFLEISQIRQT